MTMHLVRATVRRSCMRNYETLDISEHVHRLKRPVVDLADFAHWASQVMGQGMHFVIGTYAELGVTPRAHWAFWAQISSPSGEAGSVAESVFTANREQGGWRYGLHFYGGDEDLHTMLADCVLHTTRGDEEAQDRRRTRHIIGVPLHGVESEDLPVTWFEVLRPDDSEYHSLGLYTAAQFD